MLLNLSCNYYGKIEYVIMLQLQRKQSDRTREIPLSECHLLELSQTQSSEMPASWSTVNKNNSLNRLTSSPFRRRHPEVADSTRPGAAGCCVKSKPISFSLSMASETTATVPENGCTVCIIKNRNDCGSDGAFSQVYWSEIKDLLQDKTCVRAILRARVQLRICGKQMRHTEARRIVCFCQIRMTRSLPNIFSSSSNTGMLDMHFCTSINVYRRVLSSFDVSRFTSRGREKI